MVKTVICTIAHKDTSQIRVEGVDIYQTIDVSPWEAGLGLRYRSEAYPGTLHVNLPKNAKNGQQLRLKDKGIPHKTAGHLYLVLTIILPACTE